MPQPPIPIAARMPTRMRVLAIGALALAGAALPRAAMAEVVVMRSGSRISCSRAVTETSRLRLDLAGGGVLHVALADVKRIESGTGSPSKGLLVRSSVDSAFAPSGGNFDTASRSLKNPIASEVARSRAESVEVASPSPTIVGSLAGVAPVPMSPQLRSPAGAPMLDARRQAFAERARIAPGSAGGLLSNAAPGGRSRGSSGLDDVTGRDAPRVPR